MCSCTCSSIVARIKRKKKKRRKRRWVMMRISDEEDNNDELCIHGHARISDEALRIIMNYVCIPRGGGGGTSILKVSGTCRWQGYDFAIIAIKTGCLNQPNHWHRVSKSAYLATGTDYFVYHRVAFPPTMFMTGPRSRHRRDASVRAGPVFQRSIIFFLWTGVNYMKIIFIEFVL